MYVDLQQTNMRLHFLYKEHNVVVLIAHHLKYFESDKNFRSVSAEEKKIDELLHPGLI